MCIYFQIILVSFLESDREMKGLMRALRFYARKSTSFSQVVSAVRFSNFLSADRNSRCLATCSKILKERQYRPRRAVLYVPGNDERKLQKIASLNVDCAVMDCEDGVAINRKVIHVHSRYRPLAKSGYQKINFLISLPKHMLWVLKRTVSLRWFF